MLRLTGDQNFDGPILRGLFLFAIRGSTAEEWAEYVTYFPM